MFPAPPGASAWRSDAKSLSDGAGHAIKTRHPDLLCDKLATAKLMHPIYGGMLR
jgi:hypothetical protein